MHILSSKPNNEAVKAFADHATQDELWDIDRRQAKKSGIIIGNDEMLRQHGNRLICPRCERAALRYGARDRARCKCGWEGKSITVDEYMTEKLYGR